MPTYYSSISTWALPNYYYHLPLAIYLWWIFFHHDSSPYMQWFKCDDAWITKATAEEVLASEG